jgi:HEPN domain-containing protein
MTAKKTRRAPVTQDEVKKYLSKADEFLRTARRAIADGDYYAASLNAVHAAISANDAVTGYFGGTRSTSEDHRDAANLLMEFAPREAEEWKKQASRLGRIISEKSQVAYGVEIITAKGADHLVQQAERFVDWAKGVVGD